MIIVPVNVESVLQKVGLMLKNWEPLRTLNAKVQLCEEINEEPRNCPWVGVYRLRIRYPARTLGIHAGFRENRLDLVIVTQSNSTQSGEQCLHNLEELNEQVVSCLLSDPSLGGAVDTLDEFEVNYPEYSNQDGMYFQSSLIYFTGVTQVGAQ